MATAKANRKSSLFRERCIVRPRYMSNASSLQSQCATESPKPGKIAFCLLVFCRYAHKTLKFSLDLGPKLYRRQNIVTHFFTPNLVLRTFMRYILYTQITVLVPFNPHKLGIHLSPIKEEIRQFPVLFWEIVKNIYFTNKIITYTDNISPPVHYIYVHIFDHFIVMGRARAYE